MLLGQAADVVVALDGDGFLLLGRPTRSRRVDGARKVAPLARNRAAFQLAASALNTSTNRPPMILRLLGSLTPASLQERSLASTRMTLACNLPLEHVADHVAFQAQQAVVDEHAGQLVADGRWMSAAATGIDAAGGPESPLRPPARGFQPASSRSHAHDPVGLAPAMFRARSVSAAPAPCTCA